MQAPFDYKRFAILYVDDEEKSLKYFARAFDGTFRILTAPNAKDGLRILEEHQKEIAILMTDQRMPGEKGVWLLEKARQLQPRMLRILVTAYTDMEAAIAAVNSGAIYKYVNKPWDPVQLEQTLKHCLEFFAVQWERDQLLQEKVSVLHNMMVADRIVSLGLMAAGLSHHIRNALVAVKTFLDLAPAKMQEEKASPGTLLHPDFWRDYYQNVQGQIHKINNMLQQLGSASEETSLQFTDQVRLHEVVSNTIAAAQTQLTQSQILVESNIPDSLPTLHVDKARFARLFELLLKDEMVSLPPGSKVTFTARMVEDSVPPNSEIEVRIQDNGPRLARESLRLLFDPFSVRSESPMEYGINLMACYFIVHHHGGRIHAESPGGQGTTFTLRLPINPSQSPRADQRPDFLQKLLLNQALWEKLAGE